MIEVAEEVTAKAEAKPILSRRFVTADLTADGPWILERLLKIYPNQTERSIIGWLNGVVFNNDYLFIRTENAVALAERVSLSSLAPKMVVREIFVWCRDANDAEQIREALVLYVEMVNWAKFQQIERVIVLERSDIAADEIRKIFQRVHEFKTHWIRVG